MLVGNLTAPVAAPRLEEEVLRLPTPFYLFRLITGSDHLHFGYFKTEYDGLDEAQESMMELHLFFRPRRAFRVLDVGCGLGATARRLARLGCSVTAVCPDVALVRYARAAETSEPAGPPIEWVESRFEEWAGTGPFDLVMFQESFQYFDDVDATLRRAHALLCPGGRLLVGDQFLNEDRPRQAARFHFVDRFLAAARASGFRVTTQCDVSGGAFLMTERVLERLRAAKDELIARHEARKPTIRKDIEDMLYWGGQELGAFEHSVLSYRLVVLDR